MEFGMDLRHGFEKNQYLQCPDLGAGSRSFDRAAGVLAESLHATRKSE